MRVRRRSGFTLLELVLVVGMVAMLAALLFPVLARARKSARMAGCTGNLRQIAAAQALYLADYGGYPHPIALVREVNDRRVLTCPEDNTGGGEASSYTFRSLLPQTLKPYWESQVDGDNVLVVCNHHLERQVTREGDALRYGEARYPIKLALRADGRVDRIHLDQVREEVVPGPKLRFIYVYPGESPMRRAAR